MKLFGRSIKMMITAMAITAMGAIVMPSCDSLIYDDLDPCPQGARLRFVYDYNMEFANAFPSQVDCLTLLVYDGEGNYLQSFVQPTDELLSDENWRLTLDLTPGDYIFEAWGGMACSSASFHFNAAPETQPLQSLQVAMNSDVLTSPRGTNLHPLFFGQLSMTVPEESMDYTEGTVKMMKDTNNFRILLQSLDGNPTDGDDFDFAIIDDNTLFNYDNDVVPQSNVTYNAWTWGQSNLGEFEDGQTALAAFAEISTSRLMENSGAKLVVKRHSDGATVIDVPLINILLALKSQQFDWMESQEFLDRESRWDMVFFLSNGLWITTYIKIGPWIVRINDINFDTSF